MRVAFLYSFRRERRNEVIGWVHSPARGREEGHLRLLHTSRLHPALTNDAGLVVGVWVEMTIGGKEVKKWVHCMLVRS